MFCLQEDPVVLEMRHTLERRLEAPLGALSEQAGLRVFQLPTVWTHPERCDRAKNASGVIEKVDGKVNHPEQFDDFEETCLASIYAKLPTGYQSRTYNEGGVA